MARSLRLHCGEQLGTPDTWNQLMGNWITAMTPQSMIAHFLRLWYGEQHGTLDIQDQFVWDLTVAATP